MERQYFVSMQMQIIKARIILLKIKSIRLLMLFIVCKQTNVART